METSAIDLAELESLEDLDRALAQSFDQPVLLFKHSAYCSISSRALAEFESYIRQADPRVICKLIVIQKARDVSEEAAVRLALEHESPQVILVRRGQQVWNASHRSITLSSIDEAIRSQLETAT